jgi:hypothetical protein
MAIRCAIRARPKRHRQVAEKCAETADFVCPAAFGIYFANLID